MMKMMTQLSAIVFFVVFAASRTLASDLYNYTVSALKAPDCVENTSDTFVSQNFQRTQPIQPVLPNTNFYMLVRFLGNTPLSYTSGFDFSKFPDDYGDPSLRGAPLTSLRLPDPVPAWQRAGRPDATLDNASAFGVHCYDASSFINTWTFPQENIVNAGPHSIYGYSFNDPPPPAIFDGNPATDFVLQASIEVPWFAKWADPATLPSDQPIGQVNLFAYLRDRDTGKTFALLLAIFDDRFADNPMYQSFVAHDGQTPFVSMPLKGSAVYATLSPYSSTYTGIPWSGLRFFRAHITQDDFRRALADLNAFCAAHRASNYCNPTPLTGNAYSESVQNYDMTDFGVIHEVSTMAIGGNLSMGVHIYGLGAWNFR